MTLVEIRALRHRVLHDIDLTLAPGKLVVLAGRSGSGKSTLCHLIAGIMPPASGDVLVGGRPAHRVTDWATVSLLPQRPALDPELTVAENVFLPSRVRRRTADPGLLDRLGLGPIAARPARDTSLGEQQRTAMARALVLVPAVTVLDEPTAHQDDEHVSLVLDAITAVVRDGTLAVVATHDPRVIDLADRVIPIVSGTC
ncbi:ATP-binding cassette domain-containing protein [Actinoplanes sp. NPDC089786]|uniref:ATP-binding cassette domain-containing protein n=1 Tax=Actinoplanes sp. NPDC089786 TaxID=3155185 RepID=UPI00343AE974